MDIERPKELFKPCIIKPFKDKNETEQEGLIIAIRYDRCGSEVLVRYFMHGMVKTHWFFDFEIEMKKQPIKSHNKFFKEY